MILEAQPHRASTRGPPAKPRRPPVFYGILRYYAVSLPTLLADTNARFVIPDTGFVIHGRGYCDSRVALSVTPRRQILANLDKIWKVFVANFGVLFLA
jgi:hypothetical protein